MSKKGNKEKSVSNTLRIVPLGGLGEIGKNMTVFEYGGDILVVDTGIMFPQNDMLGIDYIIPDFQYLLDKRERVKGIVITHGHEDHTGAIAHVLEEINAPIYAPPRPPSPMSSIPSGSSTPSPGIPTATAAAATVQIGQF